MILRRCVYLCIQISFLLCISLTSFYFVLLIMFLWLVPSANYTDTVRLVRIFFVNLEQTNRVKIVVWQSIHYGSSSNNSESENLSLYHSRMLTVWDFKLVHCTGAVCIVHAFIV